MTRTNPFPVGSVRTAVLVCGNAWWILHEGEERPGQWMNNHCWSSLRDEKVFALCSELSRFDRRRTMWARASLGLTATEAGELIT